MGKLSEMELKMLVKGGETNTVELKLAAPRAVDLVERLCGMVNAKRGIVIIGVEDSTRKVVAVPDECIGETMDVILEPRRCRDCGRSPEEGPLVGEGIASSPPIQNRARIFRFTRLIST